jgi:hypothetical protein
MAVETKEFIYELSVVPAKAVWVLIKIPANKIMANGTVYFFNIFEKRE